MDGWLDGCVRLWARLYELYPLFLFIRLWLLAVARYIMAHTAAPFLSPPYAHRFECMLPRRRVVSNRTIMHAGGHLRQQ